jgi:PKD repeat protein
MNVADILRARIGPKSRRSKGQSMVEFALIVPIFLFLLLIAIDFGRTFFSYIEVNNAAREGAAYAAGNPTALVGANSITSHALQETNVQQQGGENPITVTAACADPSGNPLVGGCAAAPGGGGIGNSITVNVAEPFTFVTPVIGGFFNNSFTISASASAAVLSLAASGAGTPGQCIVAPTASFTTTVSGRTVTLDANTSSPTEGACAISGYNWDMGDGADPFPPVVGIATSYTFAADGVYTITLEVTNPAASPTTSQIVTIGTPTPTPTPTATPTPTPTPIPTPTPTPTPTPGPVCAFIPSFSVNFTGSGNGDKAHQMTFHGDYTGHPTPLSWSWTLGDSTTDTGQTVDNRYSSAGTYTVKLTIKNGACQQSVSQQVTVP